MMMIKGIEELKSLEIWDLYKVYMNGRVDIEIFDVMYQTKVHPAYQYAKRKEYELLEKINFEGTITEKFICGEVGFKTKLNSNIDEKTLRNMGIYRELVKIDMMKTSAYGEVSQIDYMKKIFNTIVGTF